MFSSSKVIEKKYEIGQASEYKTGITKPQSTKKK